MLIVIGKIGRSSYFNRTKWGHNAGNNEFPILLSALARLNPQNIYYMIGKSDLSRINQETYDKWFPNKNVIDVWEGFNPKTDDPTTWVWERLKDVEIDVGIIHGGMCSLSIPGRIFCLDRKTKLPTKDIRRPIMSLVNYVSPITYYLNESRINWLTITSDGRYMPLPARDMINPEKISLGVREGEVKIKRMKSYEDQVTMVEHTVKLKYAAAETQYLLDSQLKHPNKPKTEKFSIFFHQYDDKKRIKVIQDFCINNFDDIKVYGKWDETQQKGNERKFMGSVSFDELQTILPSVKYTFCYPIIKGDISGKWVEAVAHGIIPFFHETYDEDRLLVKYHGVPDWLYVSSPEELKQKVEFLETHPGAYPKMRLLLRDAIIQQKYKDGTHFNNLINKSVEEMKNGK
jgi:hypothetical protein